MSSAAPPPVLFNSSSSVFKDGLKNCSSMSQLKQYHSQLIRLGLSSNNSAITQLLKFCTLHENGDLLYAIQLFDTIPHPDTFVYNTIMRGFLHSHLPTSCILLYSKMLQDFVTPNGFTFPCVLKACCFVNGIEEGKQIHAHVLKWGFGSHIVSLNNLIHMYVSFLALDEARKVFDGMAEANSVSWITLLSGYSRRGMVDEAFRVFQLMPERNSASWNAMIAAYVQNNMFPEAFALFDRMRAENVVFDKYVAATMLSACTGLGAFEQGQRIHKYIEQKGIEVDSKLATAIIDMYSKCGCLNKALEVFDALPHKGISSWNCMIGGLAMHGKGEAAILLFKEMEKQMVTPDNITFVNLLSACAHSGLIEEGRYYFDYMIDIHRIEPSAQHFGCMVDLYGRAGMLQDATKLIQEMPMEPDASVLGALVAACKRHKRVGLGEEVGKTAIELDPMNSGRYVMMANLYASAGKWEEVAMVRKLMNDRGVKKAPGLSMIEIKGSLNEFMAGDRSHPEAEDVYRKVDEMLESIKASGYVTDVDESLQDFDEEEEETVRGIALHYHSEKLAIAYGLLKTEPGEVLRITKNLGICRDCHEASKLISEVYDREIIVRDRLRFHHFRMGRCSCNDYW